MVGLVQNPTHDFLKEIYKMMGGKVANDRIKKEISALLNVYSLESICEKLHVLNTNSNHYVFTTEKEKMFFNIVQGFCAVTNLIQKQDLPRIGYKDMKHQTYLLGDNQEVYSYIDVVTKFGKDNGRLCYYIQAFEGISTPYGPVLDGSYSNISCVTQTALTFIPSVFTPNGDEHNEVFQPVSFFVSKEGYSFMIYNRQGTLLFSTDNPDKGWDGTYKGNIVQNGEYVYHLQYFNSFGELVEEIDIITLIR